MKVTVKNMNRFLMFKLPAAFFCGVRLRVLEASTAKVTVRYKWINQNPFKSMYFAVQSMAAELTTGALVIKKIQESGHKISMLVTNHSGTFTKKAIGKITFTCNDGYLITEALQKTIATGEGQTVCLKSVGVNEQNEQVSAYEFEWSVKLKS
jgi:hypothetical protein